MILESPVLHKPCKNRAVRVSQGGDIQLDKTAQPRSRPLQIGSLKTVD